MNRYCIIVFATSRKFEMPNTRGMQVIYCKFSKHEAPYSLTVQFDTVFMGFQ